MKSVYKYPIPIQDEFDLTLPFDARILSFQCQREIPCIWALIDVKRKEPIVERHFRLSGTGHNIDITKQELEFIGTAQMANGNLVWHLFEIL